MINGGTLSLNNVWGFKKTSSEILMDSKTWSSADLIMLFIKIIGWGLFEKIGFVFEA